MKGLLGNLHHAYIIENSGPETFSELATFLEKKLNFKIKENPDFFHYTTDTFGIEESRELKAIHVLKSFSENSKKIFVYNFSFITHEAQNALLKVLEEPNHDNYFFFLVPSANIFLPTVLSRVMVVSTDSHKDVSNGDLAKEFLGKNISDRLKYIEKITGKDTNSKSVAIDLLKDLEVEIYSKFEKDSSNPEHKKALEEIIILKKYLSDRSPSVKMILEYLAVNI
jgi:DNA polymerase-3 subunit delta'